MILAVDVHYREEVAKAVGVLFDWLDMKPKAIIQKSIEAFEEYIPGEFYKRELPCIVELLKDIDIKEISAIIIDGYVYLDNEGKYGLGGYLYEYLEREIPIIGVAKTSFHNNEKMTIPIIRGKSKKPLYISSIGIEASKAAEYLKSMLGDYRIPDILKQLDQVTKSE